MKTITTPGEEYVIRLETVPYTRDELNEKLVEVAGVYAQELLATLLGDRNILRVYGDDVYPYGSDVANVPYSGCPYLFYLPLASPRRVVLPFRAVKVRNFYEWISEGAPILERGTPRMQLDFAVPEKCVQKLIFTEMYTPDINERDVAGSYLPDDDRARYIIPQYHAGRGMYRLPRNLLRQTYRGRIRPVMTTRLGQFATITKKTARVTHIPTHAGILRWAAGMTDNDGEHRYTRARELIVYFTPWSTGRWRDGTWLEDTFMKLMECALTFRGYPHSDTGELRLMATRLSDIRNRGLKGEFGFDESNYREQAMGGWAHPSAVHDYDMTAQFEVIEIPLESDFFGKYPDGLLQEYEWNLTDLFIVSDASAEYRDGEDIEAFHRAGSLIYEGMIEIIDCLGREYVR